MGITFTLAASAAAGNRAVEFRVDDGTGTHFVINAQSVPGQLVAPSGVGQFNVGAYGQNLTGNSRQTLAVPLGIELAAGWRMLTLTGNIAVGDQYQNIWYAVEEWDA